MRHRFPIDWPYEYADVTSHCQRGARGQEPQGDRFLKTSPINPDAVFHLNDAPLALGNDSPPPRVIDIYPDIGCEYAWDEKGDALDHFVHYWPDLPELAEVEERLVAWAETYERLSSDVYEILEIYDRNDIDGYYERGKTHAAELARLLEPKGVVVTFCGERIESGTDNPG